MRDPQANYRVRPQDPYLGSQFAKAWNLRGGEWVEAEVAKGKGGKSKGPQVQEIISVNERDQDTCLETKSFESLTAIDPERQLCFETPDGPVSMRVIDLLTPIGLGQRGLIVASPRTGKTVLLQQLAHGVATNFPDVYMMVLLIDERPEEVTEMRRNVHGEVIASSNDENIASHVRIARLMIAKAKRLVEVGRDVVILLDSLTRLGRAFNAHIRGSGRIMSGGLDIRALEEPKSIFGAARNVEGGGSLTIVASALIDTGSRMDEVIFNEFKGTGNMEIMLSRDLANFRVWPAIDLNASGTRKEERLLTPETLDVSHQIRRHFLEKPPRQAMELLLEKLAKYPDNNTFVKNFDRQSLR